MESGVPSPRNLLSRERLTLKSLVEESKENEKKRLAHLLILSQKASMQCDKSSLGDISINDEITSTSNDHNDDSLPNYDLETLRLFEIKYNNERIEEQKRISKSFEEYSALKQAFLQDELKLHHHSHQPEQPQTSTSNVDIKKSNNKAASIPRSRFAGLQSQQDHDFHRYVCKKFEKDYIKQKYLAEKAHTRYDPIEEKKKLKLLHEKKDILTRMIVIQNKELIEIHSHSLDHDSIQLPHINISSYHHHHSKASSSSSIAGYSHTSAADSYATFGPGFRSHHTKLSSSSSPRPAFVPKLSLANI